ncbi:MAG: HAD-IA family hydrolase [Pseudomonadales bacterium]|nr:HAD-IA family hydrolase [Pseudomonadales bacterium]
MYPETVLFDLDGTLLDTAPDFILVLNALREEYGLGPLPNEIIRNTVSNGARALVTLGFDVNEGDVNFETYREKLLKAYQSQLGQASCLFPGINNLLKKLEEKNIPWGVVTNKPSRFAIPLLETLALSQRCDVLICADQVTDAKPHPESLLKACKLVNAKPENSIYIGDHKRDIEAGQRANMTTITALFGYISTEESPVSWRATYLAQSADDIYNHIFNK